MKNLLTILSQKTNPKARIPNKMTSSEMHKIKKVIIGDHPVQYLDGYVAMDKDFDSGYSFWGREDG